MALQTVRDIPLQVSSDNVLTERRITPSWTVTQLKGKLESVTGIPPSCQKLVLRVPGHEDAAIAASDEDKVQVGSWRLQADAEIHVRSLLEFWCYCTFMFLRVLPCPIPLRISNHSSLSYIARRPRTITICPWLRLLPQQDVNLLDTVIKACCSTHSLRILSIRVEY